MLDPNRPLFIATNGHVCSLDPATGREHWRIKLPKSRGVLVSLMFSDGLLFAGCGGKVYALEPASGRVLWFNSLPGTGYQPVLMTREGVGSDQDMIAAGQMAADAAADGAAAAAAASG